MSTNKNYDNKTFAELKMDTSLDYIYRNSSINIFDNYNFKI